MTPPASPEQRFVGAFLLGTAALAIFDFWFPGLLLLLGACLVAYSTWQGAEAQSRRAGILLLLVGATYWLWRVLGRFAPDYVFPLVMIVVALVLLLRVDFPYWNE
jgi:hypothetical protein